MSYLPTTRVSEIRPAVSVVIPAYNEAARLPRFLRELLAYLDREYATGYEVVVVDDGSENGLEDALKAESFEFGVRKAEGGIEQGGPRDARIVLLRHDVNRGKGAAVRTGVLASAGDVVLLCDADGATRIEDERRLTSAILEGADLAIGSRYVKRDQGRELGGGRRETTVTRHPLRRAAGWLFSRVVRALFRLSVVDTQCGFKMLRGDVARSLFANTRETGYLVDLELLLLAETQGCRVEEVAVSWQEMPGSRLSLWNVAWPVAIGLWRLQRRMRVSGIEDSRSCVPFPLPQTAAWVSHDLQKKRGSNANRSSAKS